VRIDHPGHDFGEECPAWEKREEMKDNQIGRYLNALPLEHLDLIRGVNRSDAGLTVVWSYLPMEYDVMPAIFEDCPLYHAQLGKYDNPNYDKPEPEPDCDQPF
jgi:hypothetical protein